MNRISCVGQRLNNDGEKRFWVVIHQRIIIMLIKSKMSLLKIHGFFSSTYMKRNYLNCFQYLKGNKN